MSPDGPFPLLAAWRDQPAGTAADLLGGVKSLCIVAPHPDDETLGCGLLLLAAAERGLPVTIVCMTDGSRSHPGSATWPAHRLAAERRLELTRAVRCLAPAAKVVWLGYPDTGLPTDGPALVAARGRLARHLPRRHDALILTTWPHDPHGDHASTARLVQDARGPDHPARLFHYPIWGRFLEHAPAPGLDRAFLVAGDTAARARKRRALACHRTQMSSLIGDDPEGFVMPEWMQEHFVEHPEIYLAA
jgi:LmbE family N-acetylglucosaminyl deacetylase